MAEKEACPACGSYGSGEGCLVRGTDEARTTEYPVFPGISLIYNDIHARLPRISDEVLPETVFEINHCREGRMECRLGDRFFYLAAGDMSVGASAGIGEAATFPLSHYHGITVRIDTARAPGCLSCFLDDVKVSPAALRRKFCPEGGTYIARSDPSVAHIFTELYHVPEHIRRGYCKVKVLELLLFLSAMEPESEQKSSASVPAAQVQLAKRVADYLTEHMDERITLEAMAGMFYVSATQIKSSFRAVYGESVYAFIRAQKMQAAGVLLRGSDATVLEVAGRLGYDNASKFAKAFADVMGMTPTEYRRGGEK